MDSGKHYTLGQIAELGLLPAMGATQYTAVIRTE